MPRQRLHLPTRANFMPSPARPFIEGLLADFGAERQAMTMKNSIP